MKIAIKVSDISSLLNYNNFKSRDVVVKNIKSRLYRISRFMIPENNTKRQIRSYFDDNENTNEKDLLDFVNTVERVIENYNMFFLI